MRISHASLLCGPHLTQDSDCHIKINKPLGIKYIRYGDAMHSTGNKPMFIKVCSTFEINTTWLINNNSIKDKPIHNKIKEYVNMKGRIKYFVEILSPKESYMTAT